MTYALNKFGPWLPVKVTGSTSGAIQAGHSSGPGGDDPRSEETDDLRPHATQEDRRHQRRRRRVDIESYLEQINPGQGPSVPTATRWPTRCAYWPRTAIAKGK